MSGCVSNLLEFLLDQPEMARISDTGVGTRNPLFKYVSYLNLWLQFLLAPKRHGLLVH